MQKEHEGLEEHVSLRATTQSEHSDVHVNPTFALQIPNARVARGKGGGIWVLERSIDLSLRAAASYSHCRKHCSQGSRRGMNCKQHQHIAFILWFLYFACENVFQFCLIAHL